MESFTLDEITDMYMTVNPTLMRDFDPQKFVEEAPDIDISPIIDIVCHKIIQNTSPKTHSPYIFQKQYDEIIYLSDIHADILSLTCNLIQAGYLSFVDIKGVPRTKDGLINEILLNYNTFNVWDLLMNYNIVFGDEQYRSMSKKTCIVFVGDLIDGLRGEVSVKNRWGLNELGIHIMLYQLRISAIEIGSQIHILYGNHEFETLIRPSSHMEFYEDRYECLFVDIIVRALMNPTERCLLLLPFYLIDNSMFKLVVDFNDLDELNAVLLSIERSGIERERTLETHLKYIVCHGGFNQDIKFDDHPPSSVKIDYTFDSLVQYNRSISAMIWSLTPLQLYDIKPPTKLHRYMDVSGLKTIPSANINDYAVVDIIYNLITARSLFFHFVKNETGDIILNSHVPSDQTTQCALIKEHFKKTTLIMGHCITHSITIDSPSLDLCFDRDRSSTTKECIYPMCVQKDTRIPNIIFIDNAIAIQNTLHKRTEVTTVRYKNYFTKNGKQSGTVDGNVTVRYPNSIPIFNELLCVTKHNEIKIIRNLFSIDKVGYDKAITVGRGKTNIYDISIEDAVLLPTRKLEGVD